MVRTSDGYRFGLQFKNLSDAHRQVGEFLESLGNKKSEAVVTALIEYIKAHPEVLNRDNPIKVVAAYGYSEETLKSMLEELLKKHVRSDQLSSDLQETDSIQDDVNTLAMDALLDGLEKFG